MVAFSTPLGVVRHSMKPCGLFLISGLLLLEQSTAHSTSHSSSSRRASLMPDVHIDVQNSFGAQSFMELGGSGLWTRPETIKAEIRASSSNAPAPSSPGATNILTVAVHAKEPLWQLKLSLPERQHCPEDPTLCFGYEFLIPEGTSQQCDIAAWPYGQIDLPKSKMNVVDVEKEQLIEDCTVNNTAGNYGTAEHRRSEMLMTFKQDSSLAKLTDTWLVFRIKVRNPPSTPVTYGNEKFSANTYQVLLWSKRQLLGTEVLQAPQILPVWECSYTDWMWTAPCTAKCGGGERYSVRRLLHPPPANHPRELLVNCGLPLSQTHKCNEEPCSVDCELGDWTPFADGPCSATCGKGFEVQRRRVVEGPIGNGKLCPDFNEVDVRVRYRECEAPQACEPRCDVEKAADSGTLYTECSNTCQRGKGKRSMIPVIGRKALDATTKTCKAEPEEKQCGVQCHSINFFPGQAGRLPRLGKWVEIALVFFLDNLAEGLSLVAPEGFDIGRTQGPEEQDGDTCILKEHNIPRLKRCRVVMEKGRLQAVFDLLNPLEPFIKTDGKDGIHTPQYQVKFYAKSPDHCPGGFNSRGACKTHEPWEWSLKTWTREPNGAISHDIEKAGFEVYNEHAKEWHPWESHHLTSTEETSFVKGDIDIDEVNTNDDRERT